MFHHSHLQNSMNYWSEFVQTLHFYNTKNLKENVLRLQSMKIAITMAAQNTGRITNVICVNYTTFWMKWDTLT